MFFIFVYFLAEFNVSSIVIEEPTYPIDIITK